MEHDSLLRIILDVILLICVLFGWWYIALPLGLICAWIMPYYFELLGAGLIYDSLYGIGRGLGVVGFAGTILAIVVIVAFGLLKLIIKW